MYKFIETGKRHPDKTDMVFAAIYCEAGTVHLAPPYINVPKGLRGTPLPLVLMMLRWDGCIGFPGGKVESREELLIALRRECEEEVNFKFSHVNSRLALLCSLATLNDDRHIHCYEYQISNNAMIEAVRQATEGEHFMHECMGCVTVPIANFEGGGGVIEFFKHNFKATAKMELECLIKRKGWLPI